MRLETTCPICKTKGPIEMICGKCPDTDTGPYHMLDRFLETDGPILHALRLVVQDKVGARKALEFLRGLRNGEMGPGDMPMVTLTMSEFERSTCEHLYEEGAEPANCVKCGAPSKIGMIEEMEVLPVEGKDYQIISAPGQGEMEAMVFESGKPFRSREDGGIETIDAMLLRGMAERYGWRIEEIEGGEVRAFVRVDNVVIGGAISGTITIPDPVATPTEMTSIKEHKIAGKLEEGDLFWWGGKKARAASVPEFSDDGEFIAVTLINGDPQDPDFDKTIEDPETIGVAVELEMIGE